MAVVTFLSESERYFYSKVENEEINELLQEVRSKFDNEYLLHENIKMGIFFTKMSVSYTLYKITSWPEVQVVGIGTDASHIMAYFCGLLNGHLKGRNSLIQGK